MPFWKKSEDPWDLDPAKERAKQEREPLENPLDTLREWNEARRAKAAAKQAEHCQGRLGGPAQGGPGAPPAGGQRGELDLL